MTLRKWIYRYSHLIYTVKMALRKWMFSHSHLIYTVKMALREWIFRYSHLIYTVKMALRKWMFRYSHLIYTVKIALRRWIFSHSHLHVNNRYCGISYNLSFTDTTATVGRCQCRRAGFWVPWHASILWCTTNWQRVYTVSVTITVTIVIEPASITRRPHKDWTETASTL